MGAVRESALVNFEALADDPSVERRAELLDSVGTLFTMVADSCAGALLAVYDTVLIRLADMAGAGDRSRLSARIADLARAPGGIVRRLAMDDIAVAEPLLLRSPVLNESDLVSIAQLCGNRHRGAIARRPEIGPPVTLVLVTRGDDEVRRAVAENTTARFSEGGMDRLVFQAAGDPSLQVLIACHPDVTARAAGALRVFASPEALALLDAPRQAMRAAPSQMPAGYDFAAAAIRVGHQSARGELDIAAAARHAGENRFAEAAEGLARLAGLPTPMVVEWFVRADVRALVAAVRALAGNEADLLRLLAAGPAGEQLLAEDRIAALRQFRIMPTEVATAHLAALRAAVD